MICWVLRQPLNRFLSCANRKICMIKCNFVDAEFHRHLLCFLYFMLIMSHHKKLPANKWGLKSFFFFLSCEYGNVLNDLLEISSYTIFFVTLLRGSIDRNNEIVQT